MHSKCSINTNYVAVFLEEHTHAGWAWKEASASSWLQRGAPGREQLWKERLAEAMPWRALWVGRVWL